MWMKKENKCLRPEIFPFSLLCRPQDEALRAHNKDERERSAAKAISFSKKSQQAGTYYFFLTVCPQTLLSFLLTDGQLVGHS